MTNARRAMGLLFCGLVLGCTNSPAPNDAGAGGGTGNDGGGGSGADGGAGDGGVTLIALSDYCARHASALCDRELRCGFLDASERPLCIEDVENECAGYHDRVRGGTWVYDPVEGGRCIARVSRHACLWGPERSPWMRFCVPGAFASDAGGGDKCIYDGDCARGYCPGVGLACTTCVGFTPIGQLCAEDEECDPATSFCGPNPDGGANRVCVAQLADGLPCVWYRQCSSSRCNTQDELDGGQRTCGPVGAGDACASGWDCPASMYCRGLRRKSGNLVEAGICTARIPLDAGCVNEWSDDGCTTGTCLDGRCLVVPDLSRPRGAECDDIDECDSPYWCAGLGDPPDGGVSLKEGRCVDRSDAGGPCTPSPYYGPAYENCQIGLRCAEGTCRPYASADQPCQDDLDCKSQLSCVDAGPGAVCKPAPGAGSPCGKPSTTSPAGMTGCYHGSICPFDGGNCVALHPAGVACVGFWQCQSWQCGTDAGAFCAPSCFP